MKKLIAITSIITAVTASSAFAKTEGSYLGANILRTKMDVKTSASSPTNNFTNYFNTKSKDSQTGFGINYKYAVNMDNFFIAPGVFFEQIGGETKTSDWTYGYEQKVKVNNRYGVKFDAGYDITDKFSAYVPLALSAVNYEIETKDYYDADSYFMTKTTGRKAALSYGLGLSFAATDNLLVNLEYNRSSFNLESGGNVAINGNTTLKAKTTLDVMSLGVAYKF